MHIDAAQEYRPAVQQDIGAACLDRAKTYFFADLIGLSGNLYAIEFRLFRCPQLRPGTSTEKRSKPSASAVAVADTFNSGMRTLAPVEPPLERIQPAMRRGFAR